MSNEKQSHSWSQNKILTHLPSARQLYKAQSDPSIAFPPPRFISIWISEVCNLDCTYCFFAETNHDPERKFIETEAIINWLLEMREFGSEALEFSGGGEPTVHKDFAKIFEAASNMGYALGLITHACNPMPLELLSAKAKYVRCGLDAATAETHAKIKQKEGKFEKAIENIKGLVSLRNKKISNEFTVGIKVVLNSINYRELFDMIDLARRLEVNYIQIKYEHSSDHTLTEGQLDEAQELMDYESTKPEFTKVLGNTRHQKATVKCFMSPIHTVVNSRGELLQCCFMWDRAIGTIFKPIRSVWGNEQHRKIMAQTTIAECSNVDCRWNYFNAKMKQVIEDPLSESSFI